MAKSLGLSNVQIHSSLEPGLACNSLYPFPYWHLIFHFV